MSSILENLKRRLTSETFIVFMVRRFIPAILFFSLGFYLSACATKSVYKPETDRESIRAVVRANLPAVSTCYERAIDARPGAMGKVIVSWDIAGDGSVQNVSLIEVHPSLNDIRACLIVEISSWKFPPSGGTDLMNVRYPFMFDEREPMRP